MRAWMSSRYLLGSVEEVIYEATRLAHSVNGDQPAAISPVQWLTSPPLHPQRAKPEEEPYN